MSKMNIEEIKQLLREEQIREIVKDATTNWSGNRISLNDKDFTMWSHDIGIKYIYHKSGWSRSTFKKRWDQLIDCGFVKRSYYNTCCGAVESKEWRVKVGELAHDALLKQGLTREMQDVGLFPDLAEIREYAVREVLDALTHMGA